MKTKLETSGIMRGRLLVYDEMTVKPVPQERPTDAREKEPNGSETLGLFGALGGGGESTGLMAMAEKYEGNGIFGNSERSVMLLVKNRVSEYCLDGRPGLREQISNFVRLEEPREVTTVVNHELKLVVTGIISGCSIDQTGVREEVKLRL